MATNKNITMKQFNGTDYDTLYPKTKVEQVEGAYTQQQILADSTKTMFGLGTDAVPDDMWANLVPVGGILWYAKDGIPDGYLKCDGSVISRTDYARLFAVIGTAFGKGNGSTTFALPDLRAKFIRGAGTSNGYSATFGQTENATSIQNMVSQSGMFGIEDIDKSSNSSQFYYLSTSTTGMTWNPYYHHVRPYNIALTPIIKY